MSDEISVNRRALHDYHILERFEAGIALKGTEVKSIRGGFSNLNQAFARVENGQVFLYDSDIQPYVRASFEQHVAKRPRKLLLHKAEIAKLQEATAVAGHTLVGLRMYWKSGKVKVEIGIAKGKEARDKRADLKDRAVKREMEREKAIFNKKHAG